MILFFLQALTSNWKLLFYWYKYENDDPFILTSLHYAHFFSNDSFLIFVINLNLMQSMHYHRPIQREQFFCFFSRWFFLSYICCIVFFHSNATCVAFCDLCWISSSDYIFLMHQLTRNCICFYVQWLNKKFKITDANIK